MKKVYYNIALPLWLIEHDVTCDRQGDIQVFCKDVSFANFGNKETPLCCPLNTERFIWDWYLRNSRNYDISFILGKIPSNFLGKDVKCYEYTSFDALQTVFDMNMLGAETAKTVMLIYATLFFHKQCSMIGYQYGLGQVRSFIKEMPIYLIVKQ